MDSSVTYTVVQSENTYGVAVKNGDVCIRVQDITPDPVAAKRLLRLLQENTVYPENVPEILDDLLGVVIW